MNQKTLKIIFGLIILAIIVLIGVVGYFVFVLKESPPEAPPTSTLTPSLPTTCTDETEGVPVITSISSYSGSVGTQLEINGCNFSGFEGDRIVYIKNDHGVTAPLANARGAESNSKLLKITIPESPICQKDNSYSGLPCDSWLNLTPGEYKIFVNPWGKESNEVTFTIK